MMYGTLEDEEQQARHLMKIANLQEKTGGFMAFIPWSFEPNMTQMQSEGLIRYPSGGLRLLKMIAISRIVYHNLINHLQSSWLTNGIGMAQLALTYGADDFGGSTHWRRGGHRDRCPINRTYLKYYSFCNKTDRILSPRTR